MRWDLETAGGFGLAVVIVGVLFGAATVVGYWVYYWVAGWGGGPVAAALSLCAGAVVFGLLLVCIALTVDLLTREKGGAG